MVTKILYDDTTSAKCEASLICIASNNKNNYKEIIKTKACHSVE